MAAQSTLLYAAVATNVALGLALLYVLRKERRSKAFPSPPPHRAPLTPYNWSGPRDQARRAGPLTPYLDRDYVPPLPQPVADVLNVACLCFLATSDASSPHLSLMRFTYTKSLTEAGGEVLVISTRRDTKKYAMLLVNSQVALLVHDFSSASAEDDANYSTRQGKARYTITLNGTVQEAHGDVAERYRAVHLQNNISYRQFIEGSDIAIILVTLTSARVCDVNDSVRVYSKEGLAWHEAPASGSTPASPMRTDK